MPERGKSTNATRKEKSEKRMQNLKKNKIKKKKGKKGKQESRKEERWRKTASVYMYTKAVAALSLDIVRSILLDVTYVLYTCARCVPVCGLRLLNPRSLACPIACLALCKILRIEKAINDF